MKHQVFKATVSREAQGLYAFTCITRAAQCKIYEVPTETPKDGFYLARLLLAKDNARQLLEIHVFKNFVRLIANDTKELPFECAIIDHVSLT